MRRARTVTLALALSVALPTGALADRGRRTESRAFAGPGDVATECLVFADEPIIEFGGATCGFRVSPSVSAMDVRIVSRSGEPLGGSYSLEPEGSGGSGPFGLLNDQRPDYPGGDLCGSVSGIRNPYNSHVLDRSYVVVYVSQARTSACYPQGPRVVTIGEIFVTFYSVVVSSVRFDPPGRDDRSPRSLNGEFVVISNPGPVSVDLRDWTIRDRSGLTYRFGRYSLGPSAFVRLHSGSGRNGPRDLYWGRRDYVWDNTGDLIDLRNHVGVPIDTCPYSGRERNGTKFC